VRALLPVVQEDVDIHAWYAQDWIQTGGLRVNFISSVDGAATAQGLSRGLQTPGDNAVFAALRDLADVVVVGAGTARAEGYRGIELSRRRQELRRELGFAPSPPIAVISRSLDLDPAAELFARGSERTIVITRAAADSAARARLEQVADVVVAGDAEVDLPAARAALVDRGLTRMLNEGGPTLFADLQRAGLVDELCLTLAPKLVGPGGLRIVSGEQWDGGPADAQLAGVLEEDGALFLRYRKPGTMSSRS
jgi:riboflavin biosynthesis pyrimidine reductase